MFVKNFLQFFKNYSSKKDNFKTNTGGDGSFQRDLQNYPDSFTESTKTSVNKVWNGQHHGHWDQHDQGHAGQQPMTSSNKSAMDQNTITQEELSSNMNYITMKGSNQPVCKWMVPIGISLQNNLLEWYYPCSRTLNTIIDLIDYLKDGHIKERHHRNCMWGNCRSEPFNLTHACRLKLFSSFVANIRTVNYGIH